MRYHIWTEGCQMNEADSAKLAAGLARLGYQEASRPEEADLAVVNTCVVRQKAEDRAISYLGYLRHLKERKNPGLRIAVMGCLVGPKVDELKARLPFVDIWARPQDFDAILRELVPESDLGGEFWPETFPEPRGPTAYVPVIHGCDKFCTYCIVPYRRGRERSRPIADVQREVRYLCSRGVREVTLLGQTVEAYGHDLPDRPDLGDLMAAIHDTPGLERIRFLTSYPRDMTERIVRRVAELPKVCEYFNIPVQSGDDAVLARMRRGYTVAEYLEKIDLIRGLVPGAAITTDVIVGFCGETEEEFQHTLDLLARVRFDKVHVAAYSPRPGTIAWRRMEDDVPHHEKMRRLRAVEELQENIARQLNEALVGTVQEVLVEGERGGKLYGRTRTNKLVHFPGQARPGQMVSVRIERASPWSLQGELVGAAAPATA
ncbi:MAG: tRNA (N6-isopentenyl adenosine(37)-C2)-methylthiotransferase MiaB [Dehalococcoidia bacterium]|nr:tRNA (N6-isopentenyl adenosine(37)-C2)-methylthiotransferase MiaB [Dehalococcoidia bacterium]MDW8009556.1 tRNA (N6-isopentenyl adenosine(37)-C2)-methylthiotransferase MiaB [Chloroflexota bacterium]